MTTQWNHNQICMKIKWSEFRRMWQLNGCVSMISHITQQWSSCLKRGQWKFTCDSDYIHMWLWNSIIEVFWGRPGLIFLFGMNRFVKTILESIPKVKKKPSRSSKLETTNHGRTAKNPWAIHAEASIVVIVCGQDVWDWNDRKYLQWDHGCA